MHKPNRALVVLTLANLLLIFIIGEINGTLAQWGLFLYLPGLLVLPSAQHLDCFRSSASLFLSGLLYDHSIHATFGFHAFAMAIVYLLLRKTPFMGNSFSPAQSRLLSLSVNLCLAIAWGLFSLLSLDELAPWGWSRFLIDATLSSFMALALGSWFSDFCNYLLIRTRIISNEKNSSPE